MRNFIIKNNPLLVLCLFGGSMLLFSLTAPAQKLAIIVPEKNGQSQLVAERLENALSEKFKVLDSSMSETAFRSASPEKPFNLPAADAKIIGAAIGCDFFLLVKSENLRRNSFALKDHFESYAAVYVVSSRTGRLVFWRLATKSGIKAGDADKLLFDSITALAVEIAGQVKISARSELDEKIAKLEEIPDENSPEAKNFRPPLPYKRLRPAYTDLASLYKIEATVDIEVDFDAEGRVLRTEIVRWAGYGLDEAVTEIVRKMNWRPAERDQKPVPMRVLLRYNFKKLDKEE